MVARCAEIDLREGEQPASPWSALEPPLIFHSSDLLSRHVNKCHTPGGLANTSSRKGQGSARAQAAAAEDKKRRPCEACTLQSTKCDFGKPCSK